MINGPSERETRRESDIFVAGRLSNKLRSRSTAPGSTLPESSDAIALRYDRLRRLLCKSSSYVTRFLGESEGSVSEMGERADLS